MIQEVREVPEGFREGSEGVPGVPEVLGNSEGFRDGSGCSRGVLEGFWEGSEGVPEGSGVFWFPRCSRWF